MSRKPKMTICRNCNMPIATDALICPSCGVKNKKPFYKKWWFILLFVLFVIGAANSIGGNKGKKVEEVDAELIASSEATADDSEVTETDKTIDTEPKNKDKDANLIDGMRPEFKQAMDSYEEFMKEYCDFMEKYSKSDGTDLELLADYADYMSKYADVVEDFEAWDSEEMNSAEAAYYLEVQTRISKKLLKVVE